MDTHKTFELWKQKAVDDADIINELDGLQSGAELDDRFYRELEFGTGGLRGVIGAGTNRMNIYTVGQATQGLASYIARSGLIKRVAIAYDSRIKSDVFAKHAACVLAANSIEAVIYPRLMPTPALSFAVRRLECDAGICVTASHNPAKYNGYKVYGADGCQITQDAAEKILSEIRKTGVFNDVKVCGFDDALTDGRIKYINEDVVEAYLAAVLAERVNAVNAPLKLVYTPLNGTGLECVTRTLKLAGYSDISVVEEQRLPDGNFPTCPYPNPEIKEALQLGIRLCEELEADLLLATDPDCDRVGVAVKCESGYRLINGNEMGALLFDYICVMRQKHNTMPQNPVAVKSIVTTAMAERIANHYGVEMINVLTGFKYIGEQIGKLEQTCESERYIFGFEESYGYLSGGYVRDKDGVNACLLICDMAAWYKSQRMTLADALNELCKKFGFWSNSLDSFEFAGKDGFAKMQEIMRFLRQSPPETVAGHKLVKATDFLRRDNTEPHALPGSDVLQFLFEDGACVTIRPSGTEPKLKVYCEVSRESADESKSANQKLREEIILCAGLSPRRC